MFSFSGGMLGCRQPTVLGWIYEEHVSIFINLYSGLHTHTHTPQTTT